MTQTENPKKTVAPPVPSPLKWDPTRCALMIAVEETVHNLTTDNGAGMACVRGKAERYHHHDFSLIWHHCWMRRTSRYDPLDGTGEVVIDREYPKGKIGPPTNGKLSVRDAIRHQCEEIFSLGAEGCLAHSYFGRPSLARLVAANPDLVRHINGLLILSGEFVEITAPFSRENPHPMQHCVHRDFADEFRKKKTALLDEVEAAAPALGEWP